MTESFEKWLSGIFKQPEEEIEKLVQDKTAIRFLIVWSILESKLAYEINNRRFDIDYAVEFIVENKFDPSKLREATQHFFERYKDERKYKNLLYNSSTERQKQKCNKILASDFSHLKDEDITFFAIFVAYRFRNNIFHGNKGVESWLGYKRQINICTQMLQIFITFLENLNPSLSFK